MAAIVTALASYASAEVLIPLILRIFGGQIAGRAAGKIIDDTKARVKRRSPKRAKRTTYKSRKRNSA